MTAKEQSELGDGGYENILEWVVAVVIKLILSTSTFKDNEFYSNTSQTGIRLKSGGVRRCFKNYFILNTYWEKKLLAKLCHVSSVSRFL